MSDIMHCIAQRNRKPKLIDADGLMRVLYAKYITANSKIKADLYHEVFQIVDALPDAAEENCEIFQRDLNCDRCNR